LVRFKTPIQTGEQFKEEFKLSSVTEWSLKLCPELMREFQRLLHSRDHLMSNNPMGFEQERIAKAPIWCESSC